MRWIGWLLLFLVSLGWLVSQWPLPPPPTGCQGELDCWRRTRNGWEPASWLSPEIPARRPALHPGVVGLLQVLLSLFALTAFSASTKATRTGGRGSRRGPNGGPHRSTQARTPYSQAAGRQARSHSALQSRHPASS